MKYNWQFWHHSGSVLSQFICPRKNSGAMIASEFREKETKSDRNHGDCLVTTTEYRWLRQVVRWGSGTVALFPLMTFALLVTQNGLGLTSTHHLSILLLLITDVALLLLPQKHFFARSAFIICRDTIKQQHEWQSWKNEEAK